jgi:hypothetical protein
MGTHKLKLLSVTDPPATTRTESKQRIRSQAYCDAVMAVEWLNASRGTAAYRRVLAVRTELEELQAEIDQLLRVSGTPREGRGPIVKVAPLTELLAHHKKFDRRLAKYSFKPELNFSLATHIWGLDMVPKHPRGRQVVVRGQGFARLGFAHIERRVPVSEPAVIVALARLATKRELAKVHLCVTCKKRWHVALRRIDKFCSAECREYFHVHSDEYRARKRESQREYRDRDNLRRILGGPQRNGKRTATRRTTA